MKTSQVKYDSSTYESISLRFIMKGACGVLLTLNVSSLYFFILAVKTPGSGSHCSLS